MKDAYRRIAPLYDRVFENMNRGLRLAGLRLFRPSGGMSILDVGCGTGAHLALYQRFPCSLCGIDRSPSMLERARARLGDGVRLDLGDATRMPYGEHAFDLVLSMLSLHEMAPGTRAEVIAEMTRVLKESGRILLIDFHPGPYVPFQGWTSKLIITVSEVAAGREHFRNYRHFLASGGLPALAAQHGLTVLRQYVLAGGSFAALLLAPSPVAGGDQPA